MNKSTNYTKNLENIIKGMLSPLKNIPLNLVIESLYGCKIVPFSRNNKQDALLLENLKKVAKLAGIEINKRGIASARPNEVGNKAEPFVVKALKTIGYASADYPKSKSGKKKSVGYPDIEFEDNFKRSNYLEVKTFNRNNMNTTQRSFYLSPSEDPKINKDGHHFLISFEVYDSGRSKQGRVFRCKSWKILTLENLQVDVKYEFNASNARLYSRHLILAQGNI